MPSWKAHLYRAQGRSTWEARHREVPRGCREWDRPWTSPGGPAGLGDEVAAYLVSLLVGKTHRTLYDLVAGSMVSFQVVAGRGSVGARREHAWPGNER